MSMNDTPSGERVHIGFFGRRNAGKSSLVNAVTGQALAVVSETLGTTTDPVRKAMELLPLGPVVIADTPGFDDEGALGSLRVAKTREELGRTDIAVLVADATAGLTDCDRALLALFEERRLPYLIAWNKCDLLPSVPEAGEGELYVSAKTGTNVPALKERLAHLRRTGEAAPPLVADLIAPGAVVVLVVPIDSAAPKGRLILPQQQVLRDVLDTGAVGVVSRESELVFTLRRLGEPPALVITDSQAFREVAKIVPETVPLTSFSILMARRKGFLAAAVRGVRAVETLQDGDRVLISEGCTHHRQCDDIGTVKLPRWLRAHTGKRLEIETSSGRSFPEELTRYALVIHCGGCMLNGQELLTRLHRAEAQGVPFTNYGVAISWFNGILPRCTAMLPEIQAVLST